MFDFVWKIVSGILFVAMLSFGMYAYYMKVQNGKQKATIEALQTDKVIEEAKHSTQILENELKHDIEKEKAVKDEEVPGSVGVHTIIFD